MLVSLIPKTTNPQNMTQLHPIALCNDLYKIGAKVIGNQLKRILDSVISSQQGAFVPGQVISDNSLIASEVAHYLHNLWRDNQGYIALKLNVSKAYDRVEWTFLHGMMIKLGFDLAWVEIIMTWVRSVSYSY